MKLRVPIFFDNRGKKKVHTDPVTNEDDLDPELSDADEDDSHTIEGVEIFRTGTWNGDKYTIADLEDMIAAFGNVGFEPPVKLGHWERSGAPAYGWITDLSRKGTRLIATFSNVPHKLFKAIQQRRFNAVSAEIFWNVTRNDKVWRRAVAGVAILGSEIPAVNLKPLSKVVFDSIDFAGVHVYTVLGTGRKVPLPHPTKEQTDMKTLEQLKAQRADLSAKLTAAQDAGDENAEAEAREKLDATTDEILEFATAKNDDKGDGDPIALRKMQDEMNAMKKQMAADAEKARKATIDAKVAAVPFPALRDHFAVLYAVAMSDAATEQTYKFKINGDEKDVAPLAVLDDLVERITSVGAAMRSEFAHSDGGNDFETDVDVAANPGDEVDRLTKEYMAKNKTEDYEAASEAVLAANPDLAERYSRGMN